MSDDSQIPGGAYARSIVRVFDRSAAVVGAGFLVGAGVVATCAHVVNSALGRDLFDACEPTEPVLVDFPLAHEPVGARWTGTARVARWLPIDERAGTGDVALLRLDATPPPGTRLPPMRGSEDLWDHEFRVLGFPADLTDGVWVTGRIREVQGTGWLQVQGASTDHDIEDGYSGSPVWDSTLGAVVGMTVARDRNRATTTAYVVPVATVLGLDPDMMPCPYQGLAPFDEDHAEYFYGRADDVDRLVTSASRHPVVAVAGASGTGKSSLLQAGLLPVLRREGAVVAEYRTAPKITVTRSLALALAKPLGVDEAILARWLPRAPELLDKLAERPVVLVMDQFEELVAARLDYAQELLALVVQLATASSSLRAVLTLRWESLGTLVTPELATVFEDSTVFVAPMRRQQLYEVIVRPAEHAPGLSFENGLVERILDDAGAEPGQLPLVESLLTELWKRRTGGGLTKKDYNALGGVSGALVELAEGALREFPDPEPLRRLFTRLARPSDDGGFVRASAVLDQLETELQDIAHQLAASRLLVLGSAADGTPTVELAHQALIDHWPRLHEWLTEDRDFLFWRQRLETQYQQWISAKQDSGALLRGTSLATALDWERDRKADVSEQARTYIRLSRRRQRREVRRWRVVTAVLAVLVLAAGALTVVAVIRGDQVSAQLAAAKSEVLAQRSAQHAAADPVTATQLALAAYRSDPTNLAARTALFKQYMAMRSVDAVFPNVVPATINNLVTSDDGKTVVILTDRAVTVVTGLAGPRPQPRTWDLPRFPQGGAAGVSPDGHWAIGVATDNRVLIWNLTNHSGPTAVAGASSPPPADGEPTVQVTFSPDSHRLAMLNGDNLVVRNLDSGTNTSHHTGPADDMALTNDPDQVILGHGDELNRTFDIRALSSGRQVRALPAGADVVAHGALVLTCTPGDGGYLVPPQSTATVNASDTGTQVTQFRLLSTDCPTTVSAPFTGSGFLTEVVPAPDSPATLVRVTDLRTGHSFDATTPPGVNTFSETSVQSPDERIAAPRPFRSPDGRPVLLLARSASVLRIGQVVSDWLDSVPPSNRGILTADGRHVVIERLTDEQDRTITVHDRASGAQTGQVAVHTDTSADFGLAVERALLTIIEKPASVEFTFYSLPDLRPESTYTLPGNPGHAADIVATNADGRFIVLVNGRLAMWNTDTHQMVGRPTRLGGSPGRVQFRPGHPSQVAVAHGDNTVELWDVNTHGLTTTLPAEVDAPQPGTLAFDPTGNLMATLSVKHTVRVWNVETGQPVGPAVPVSEFTKIAGFTADGYLVLAASGEGLSLFDVHSGQPSEQVKLPAFPADQLDENGLMLQLDTFGVLPVDLRMTAAQWSSELCGSANNRPFTDAERALLPPGVDTGPPCG